MSGLRLLRDQVEFTNAAHIFFIDLGFFRNQGDLCFHTIGFLKATPGRRERFEFRMSGERECANRFVEVINFCFDECTAGAAFKEGSAWSLILK